MTDLPPGWDVKALAEIANYETGRTPPRANPAYWDGADKKVSWVTISDLPAYGSVTTTKEQVSQSAFEAVFRGRLVPAGTLLMSFKLTIGRVATLGVPATHNEAIISIYPKPGIDQRYLGYYLSQVEYAAYQDRQIKGHTLNKAKLDQIIVAVPPEAEQKAIAHLLDCVRAAIESERELIAASSRLKRATAGRLFTHGLRDEPTKDSDVGLVPGTWSVEPLRAHHTIMTGATPSRGKPAYWTSGTIPWVKTTEVQYCVISQTEEHITETALKACSVRLLAPGTLLLAMYGQGVTRGKVALLGIEATCNQACAAVTASDASIDTRYLYHFLSYRYDEIRQMAHGGQQQNLNLDLVRSIPIAFPEDANEQREIVDVLDAIDRKIALHTEKRVRLDELFTILLHQVMTGAVRACEFDTSALVEAPALGEPAA